MFPALLSIIIHSYMMLPVSLLMYRAIHSPGRLHRDRTPPLRWPSECFSLPRRLHSRLMSARWPYFAHCRQNKLRLQPELNGRRRLPSATQGATPSPSRRLWLMRKGRAERQEWGRTLVLWFVCQLQSKQLRMKTSDRQRTSFRLQWVNLVLLGNFQFQFFQVSCGKKSQHDSWDWGDNFGVIWGFLHRKMTQLDEGIKTTLV